MNLDQLLEKYGELQPYDVYWCNLTNEKIRDYFNEPNVNYKYPERHRLFFLTSNSEIHDIYGNTGEIQAVVLGVNGYIKYTKYVGDQDFNADTIREHLKEYFNEYSR
jgi:hypothetical protein